MKTKLTAWIFLMAALLVPMKLRAQCSGGHVTFIPNFLQGGWSATCVGTGGPPSGAAGGDLTGTYPNPTIKASVTLTTPNIGVATGTSLALTGAVTSGSGSGVGGVLDLGQGTLPALGTTAVSLMAPTSVTSYGLLYPGAAPAANQALLWGTPSSSISTGVFTTMILGASSLSTTGCVPFENGTTGTLTCAAGFTLTAYDGANTITSGAYVTNPGQTGSALVDFHGIKIGSTAGVLFSSGSDVNSNTGSLSLISSKIIGVGGGAVGSTAGSLELAGVISVATKFTTSGGGCTVTATTGGATSGSFTTSTTGTCTTTITMNGATGLTAPNGWACSASDVTSGIVGSQSATTATTCDIKVVTTSGDTVTWDAHGY